MFVSTVDEDNAEGDVREMYEKARNAMGYIPNYTKLFSHRPQVMQGWAGLLKSIRPNLDTRRYELATIAAARELHSTYCMIAHSSVLLENNFPPDELKAIADDYKTSNLPDVDKAIMSFAAQIARDATSVTQDDVQQLRDYGLSDTEIFDVASVAAARCFFSKMLDALGAQADSLYLGLDDALRESFTVGRAIDETD